MKKYPTPHIDCSPDDFAKTVLMPGDPLRAQFVAKNFLLNARLVNNVRGIQGYTGEYKNKRISVMASGMGMPSMGIYSYELFNFFEVENILRIGTAGTMRKDIKLRDIVLGQACCTDSHFAEQFNIRGSVAPIASFELLKKCNQIGEKMNIPTKVGSFYSSDVFYSEDKENDKKLADLGVIAEEMESAALYINAMKAGKKALSICTISDNIATGESLSAKERETSFTQMMELALQTAVEIGE